MSMFFLPREPKLDAETMEANFAKMNKDMVALLPKEIQGGVELMMQPAAAFMAFGAGLAAHAMTTWLDAVERAMDSAQKLSGPAFPVAPPAAAVRVVKEVREQAEAVAESAADLVADELPLVAGSVAETAASVGVGAAEMTAAAVETAADVVETARSAVAASVAAMIRPVGIDRPDLVDDLKALSGVGPKLEKVLNGFGIWTYAQIAALAEGEVAWLESQLGFKGRIGRDRWLEQAAGLVGKSG